MIQPKRVSVFHSCDLNRAEVDFKVFMGQFSLHTVCKLNLASS